MKITGYTRMSPENGSKKEGDMEQIKTKADTYTLITNGVISYGETLAVSMMKVTKTLEAVEKDFAGNTSLVVQADTGEQLALYKDYTEVRKIEKAKGVPLGDGSRSDIVTVTLDKQNDADALKKQLSKQSSDITDMQEAMASMYESILGSNTL